MSNTYKHKNLAKYTKDLLEKTPQELQNYFDRHNNELGEFSALKKNKTEKILDKELKEQLKIDEYNFKKNGDFIEDIDDPYFKQRTMNIKETELLYYYFRGWKDELYGTTSTVPEDLLITKAYNMGANHAILGDEVKSADYLSDEEILKMIMK
jgi:hypothetical protein